MSDYVPTTEEIEDWWAHRGPSECVPYYASKLTKRVNEFKAWLSEHDAKVRAETLREAREAINTVRNVPSLIALADKFGGYHQGERAGLEMAEGVIDRIEKEAGL